SFLDINGESKAVRSLYFPSRRLFTARTLLGRVYHDLWFHFASDEEIEGLRRNNMYNNRILDSLTRDLAGRKSAKPKFIYTHLIMPHHPYFFDSAGQLTNDSLLFDSYKLNRNAYIGYLQYSNNKFLSLIDYIKEKSPKPPVIMLMSDHGFHEFSEEVDKKYHFMNLDAIFSPSGNYKGFYDGMTPVNQFRVLFNGMFQQRLPLLKDSSVFLWESKLPVIMD
ncbi:MAG: sulfatase-like hydrolase/transferase, partial [Flavisolibacter sp.]